MAKKIKIQELAQVPNSRSKEKVEHEKALKVLEDAKKLKRPARFAKQGESEFSRELKSKKSPEEIKALNIEEAAEYLKMNQMAFKRRSSVHKIPKVKINGKNYYKTEDLDFHIKQHPFKARI